VYGARLCALVGAGEAAKVRDVKNGFTIFIDWSGWVVGRVCWQEGFGAFSYSHSQLKGVFDYIRDQERHHARRSFQDQHVRVF
jgi:putative transposase